MAWEERRGRRYYYRKERDGGRVRSVYVGRDELARLVGQLTKGRQTENKQTREAERRERARMDEEDAALDALARMVETVAASALVASGYHTHKRQWRLIRGGQK